MIGVIAAGGRGTRMMPVTQWINKHLIPVSNGELMIDQPIGLMSDLGFDWITVVTGCDHAGQVSEYLKDGEKWGFKRINYEIQPKPAGIGDVVKRVSHLVGDKGMLLILGDNFFACSPTDDLKCLRDDSNSAGCWEYDLHEKEQAKSFGQIIRDDSSSPIEIVEKPKNPTHARILTGMYYFPKDVVQKVADLTPSARNELEITSLLDMYLKEKRLKVFSVKGWWCDLGEWGQWKEFVSRQGI